MWADQWFKYDQPKQWLSSGGLGAMGFGLPATLGAAIAIPGMIVIDIDGDGSFLMNIHMLQHQLHGSQAPDYYFHIFCQSQRGSRLRHKTIIWLALRAVLLKEESKLWRTSSLQVGCLPGTSSAPHLLLLSHRRSLCPPLLQKPCDGMHNSIFCGRNRHWICLCRLFVYNGWCTPQAIGTLQWLHISVNNTWIIQCHTKGAIWKVKEAVLARGVTGSGLKAHLPYMQPYTW